jgi:hypothetical protein
MDGRDLVRSQVTRRRSIVAVAVALSLVTAVTVAYVVPLQSDLSGAPAVSFEFHYDASDTTGTDCGTALGRDGVLTVTHDGGTEIAPERLRLSDETGRQVALRADCGITSSVGPRDSFTATIDANDTVRLVLLSEARESDRTLGRFDASDGRLTNRSD